MIEYILIFVLGFCAASLIVLVVSPLVHRRTVTLTERRMRATVALTSNEVRAERDFQSARRAMESARLSTHLGAEKERRMALMADHERLKSSLDGLQGIHSDLERHVEQLAADGNLLRSRFGETENKLAETAAALAAAQSLAETKDSHIEALTGRAEHLATSLESARSDLNARDQQVDRLQSEIAGLRAARSAQRGDVKRAANEARALGIRLKHESARANRLDGKLSKSVAEKIDRESELERFRSELDRLRGDLAKAGEQSTATRKTLDAVSAERDHLKAQLESLRNGALPEQRSERIVAAMPKSKRDNAAVSKRVERLRRRHNTLVNHLVEVRDDADNDHLRNEIAEIAAMMIDLTAAREGPTSPITGFLASAEQNGKNGSDAPSLAERSRHYIEGPHND